MKLINQIFRAERGCLSFSYKLYGKHKVDFQAKEKQDQQRRLDAAKRRMKGL